MKGLRAIPQVGDLATAYEALQTKGTTQACPVSDLALWSQWARFDPRLAEQLVSHFVRHWRSLPPLEFREKLLEHPWASAAGVLLSVAEIQVPRTVRALYRRWAQVVLEGFEGGHGEQFFIGLRAFGGNAMFQDALLATRPYRKRGYLGRESLVTKDLGPERTLLSKAQRRAALDKLISERKRITVRDYRAALAGQVSVRSAELDLASHPRLRPVGNTRARTYRVF